MTSDLGFDPGDGAPPARRPALYPVFAIPSRTANAGGLAIVGAAALLMIGALIAALNYHLPSPAQLGFPDIPGVAGATVGSPVNGFANRLALFVSNGAGLALAMLLVVGVTVIAMADRGADSDEEVFGWWRLVLGSAAVLAAVVLVANLGMCIEVARNASGQLIAQDSANKVSHIVGFLAPVALSVGVVLDAVYRLRSSSPAQDEIDEADPDGAGTPV